MKRMPAKKIYSFGKNVYKITNYYKLLISIIIIIIIIIDSIQTTNNSTRIKNFKCDPHVTDRCATEMVPLTNESILKNPPKNVNDINVLCKQWPPIETCLRNYANDCMEKISKQSLTVLLYSVSRLNKKICTVRKRKQNVISMMNCIEDNLDSYKNMMDQFIITLHAITNDKRNNLKIPMICCKSYEIKEWVTNEALKDCPNNKRAHEELHSWIDGYSGDVLNLICGEYTEESDKCQALTIPVWPKNKKIKWKSLIMSLVELLNSLDEKQIN